MTEESQILAILEQLLKGVEDLKKQQPREYVDKSGGIDQKITSLEAQISTFCKQAGKYATSNEVATMLSRIDEIKATRQKEVRHVYINVKNPTIWIWTAIFIMVISTCLSVLFIYRAKKVEEERDFYKQESEIKDWNYMKYKYLELFSDNNTVRNLKAFDKDYKKGWREFDKQTRKREKELDEAERARKEAELKAGESKRLQKQADSLQGVK
jgi:hypothetical protein